MDDREMREEERLAAEALRPLRGVQPPAEVSSANRLAIRMAVQATYRTPWTRRAVYVPLPAAALFIAAFLGLLAWHVLSSKPTTPVRKDGAGPQPLQQRPEPAIAIASAPKEISYEHVVYVAGLGPISRVSGYTLDAEGDNHE